MPTECTWASSRFEIFKEVKQKAWGLNCDDGVQIGGN